MRFVLIRHGESQDQLLGRSTGLASCAGLSDQGITQTRLLANRLRRTGELNDCAVLLSSPFLRAKLTTEVLIDALPVETFEEDPGLCEMHLGEGEGLTSKAYRTKYGTTTAPGEESWEDFISRVRATVQRYTEQYQAKTVVAVSHAGFIVNAIIGLFDIPRPGSGTWLEPDNTGLTEWHYTDAHWTLVQYNNTYHLKEK